MIELLSPIGDFDCLKAAVQNGADSVYFGGSLFNARYNAHNFDADELKQAIQYAKLRNVKVDFTLNTLIKNNEFADAVELANYVYSLGVDAIIVQDLGLARYLIKNFPDLPIHASTQMTIHNLHGVKELEELGFKRAVLSRELSLDEIQYICKNTNIEIETFIHGALCISYSGQCLFSSSIGARSGNRGKCAQPCRLPYKLFSTNNQKQKLNQNKSDTNNSINCNNNDNDNNSNNCNNNSNYNNHNNCNNNSNDICLDSGYLLSPRDLCGLNYIPQLINAGVSCLKIEGRMKSPEYVATVTKIYRKYIDLAYSQKDYIIDQNDIDELMQVFNRGGFSSANFESTPNRNYVFKEKPNNIGIYIGNVSKLNKEKGLVRLTLKNNVQIGDKISFEKEEHKYTISELMCNNNNLREANTGDTVVIGRMKGNLHLGDKVYKLTDAVKSKKIDEFIQKENKKIPLSAHIIVKKGVPLSLEVTSCDKENGNYFSMSAKSVIDILPIDAITNPISEDRIKEQLCKTTNSQFEFKYIKVDLDDNTYVPKISYINQLRRECLEKLEEQAIQRFSRNKKNIVLSSINSNINDIAQNNSNKSIIIQNNLCKNNIIQNNSDISVTGSNITNNENSKICLLLNELDLDYDYSKISNVDNIYVPLKYFKNKQYGEIIKTLSRNNNLYIYLPTVLKDNFRNFYFNDIDAIIKKYKIKGLICSNLSCINYFSNLKGKLDLVANYTFNVFNNYTINELAEIGIKRVVLSPELDESNLKNITNNSIIPTEVLVYGKLVLMNIGYCLLGSSNLCYPRCDMKCKENSKFYLKDRLNMNFRLIPDSIQTISTLYNSKINSISYSNIKPNFVRISILDENIDEINEIIKCVKNDKPFTGSNFTKGNFNKTV